MTIKLPKLKIKEFLFYMAYIIFLITGILNRSFYYQYFSSVYSLIKYFCIALLILKELISGEYNVKSFSIGILFVALIFITRTQSSLASFTYILIFIFCARDIDFKGIISCSAWVSLVTLFFIIVSAYMGIITNYVFYAGSRTRYYLGFLYSLYGPTFLFNITCLFVYLKKDSIKWMGLFALVVLNCWMFIMTNSRLSFILSILIIIVAGFLKLFPKFFERKRWLGITMVFSFVWCFAISLLLTVTYNASVPWMRQLNNSLGNRLSLGKAALQEYGISLFGQELKLVGNGLNTFGEQNISDTYNFVDSFYEQTLLRYGIIFTVILIVLLTYTLYYFYKKGDYWLLLWLTFVALHSIIESSMDLFYCSYWFSMSIALFQMGEKKKVRKEYLGEMHYG